MNLDWTFNWKTKKNFDWKGGIWRREMKPRNVKWKFQIQVGEKGMDRVKGYKKRIIMILLTCATPGTTASTFINML